MEFILVVHNTNKSNEGYRKELFKKYPQLAQYPNLWRLDIIKLNKKLTKPQIHRKYTSIYYDEPTCLISDMLQEYIIPLRHPTLIPIDLDKEIKTRKKNVTYIKSKVKHGKRKI